MWTIYKNPRTLFCITTNAILMRSGELVMGVGMAKQARDRIPGIAKAAGERVFQSGGGVYGFLPLNCPHDDIALFQTKVNFRDPARLDVIAKSAAMLRQWADAHPEWEIHLPYPGIGFGSLPAGVVYPVISNLPNNVYLWHR
jgi:hypothetical protein